MATPEDIKIRISAQNDSKKAFNEVNTDLKRTSTTASQTQKAVMGTTSGFSGMGRSAGQAGIQIQQLVGQIQGGTNPMLALSQQSADLGFVLGAPLLGAVGGLAASFAMVLLPALFDTTKAAEELNKEFDRLADGYDKLTEAGKAYYDFLAVDQVKKLNAEITALRNEADSLLAQSRVLRDVDKATEKYKEYLKVQDQLSQKELELKEIRDNRKGVDQEAITAIDKMIEGLTAEAATLGMTATELALYRAEQLGATDDDKKRVIALRDKIDEYHNEMAALKALADFESDVNKRRTEDQIAIAKFQKEMKEEDDKNKEALLKNLKPLEDSLVGLINGTKSVSQSFSDMASSIINDLIRIQIQQSITKPLANMLFNSGVQGGSGFCSSLGSMFGLSFAGGGYTGSGARSGGVDGQGGFPAILHPNETVVDHAQGQTGGVTINQTINVTTGVQQTVRTEIASLMPQIAAASKQAVLDARKRGGSFGAAFGA